MDINYQFKLKDGKSDITSIRFQFYIDGQRFVYGTGQKIISKLWDSENQKPIKTKSVIKPYLETYPDLNTTQNNIEKRNAKILRLTIQWFANKSLTNDAPDLAELKEYLNSLVKTQRTKKISIGAKKTELYLDIIIKDFLRAISNGKKLTKKNKRYKLGTIKGYTSLSKVFGELQDHHNRRYTIEDITKDFAELWTNYMYDERNSSNTNVGKYHKNFKSVIKNKLEEIVLKNYDNEKNGLDLVLSDRQIARINLGLDSFQSVESDTTQVYLNKEELDILLKLEKGLTKDQIIAKDVFLVGCYTALRYSDYKRIKKEHIIEKRNRKYVELHQDKTGPKVTVPIRPELYQILSKYDFELPTTYEQRVNILIKEVCKIAKINSKVEIKKNKKGIDIFSTRYKYNLISTHTARRTGATLMYLAGENSKDIMTITGHKSLSSFEKYLRITDDQSLIRMEQSDFFNGRETA